MAKIIENIPKNPVKKSQVSGKISQIQENITKNPKKYPNKNPVLKNITNRKNILTNLNSEKSFQKCFKSKKIC